MPTAEKDWATMLWHWWRGWRFNHPVATTRLWVAFLVLVCAWLVYAANHGVHAEYPYDPGGRG